MKETKDFYEWLCEFGLSSRSCFATHPLHFLKEDMNGYSRRYVTQEEFFLILKAYFAED